MSVSAADEAWSRCAYSERLNLLERALELWDRGAGEVRSALPRPAPPRGIPGRGPEPVGGRAGPTCSPPPPPPRGTAGILIVAAPGPVARWRSSRRGTTGSGASGSGPRCSLLVQESNLRGWVAGTADRAGAGPQAAPSVVHAEILVHIANWGARHRPGPESRIAVDDAVGYATRLGAEQPGAARPHHLAAGSTPTRISMAPQPSPTCTRCGNGPRRGAPSPIIARAEPESGVDPGRDGPPRGGDQGSRARRRGVPGARPGRRPVRVGALQPVVVLFSLGRWANPSRPSTSGGGRAVAQASRGRRGAPRFTA